MSQRKITLAVLFGGRSVEHDVSIVTAQQIMQACDPARYEVVPVYITREGKWLTGAPLRDLATFKDERLADNPAIQAVLLSPDVRHHGLIVDPLPRRMFAKPQVIRLDVLFPAVHGSHGEDGTLQGLFELADIPYVGFGTAGSAIGNDKLFTKQVLQQSGIPVLEGLSITRAAWLHDSEAILAAIQARFGFPVFVKPATLGSSIGVNRAESPDLLRAALDVAVNFDRRVLVEPAMMGGIEINASIIGYGDEVRVSVLEQPLSWADFLGFEDKYLRGGKGMKSADRLIPAPLTPALTERIQTIARDAFRALDGRGIARCDFLVKPEHDEVYLNEINTMPGSLSFYLWEPSGVKPAELIHLLVEYARRAYADKRASVYDYRSNLINVASTRGTKGSKGPKGSKL